MRALRIRWQGVAKVAAAGVGVVAAVAVLPGLLRAPEPPPLGRDVGLPRVGNGAFFMQGMNKAPKRRRRRVARREPERSKKAPARKPAHTRKPPPPASPAAPTPPSEPVDPAPEPVVVAPPPPPPPPPVEDGSAEFAPH